MSGLTEIDHSPRVLLWMARGCWVMASLTLLTVVLALFDPPEWNRVDRALAAFSWWYVGCLHVSLARAREDDQ